MTFRARDRHEYASASIRARRERLSRRAGSPLELAHSSDPLACRVGRHQQGVLPVTADLTQDGKIGANDRFAERHILEHFHRRHPSVAHERTRRNPSLLIYEVYHVHRVSFLEKRGLRLLVPPGESCYVLFEFVLLELTPGS